MQKMKSLEEIRKDKKTIGYYLRATWYFESFFEKAILVGLGMLGLWKILEFLF